MATTLRDLVAYGALTSAIRNKVRSLDVYIATSSNLIPKGKTGPQALLDLVVAHSSTVRPASHFVLGAVEALNGDPEFNSRVLVSAGVNSKLSGETYLRYNRIPISAAFPNNFAAVIGTAATTEALLTIVNTATGLLLTAEDIVVSPIALSDTVVNLVGGVNSRFFIPGSSVTVTRADNGQTLDTDTLTSRVGPTPTVTATNTTVSSAVKLNGRDSRSIPANTALTFTLPNFWDLDKPEWTLEVPIQITAGAVAYANILSLLNNGAWPGFAMRQSDNGFGNRIHSSTLNGAAGTWYAFPFNSVAKVGVPMSLALVRKNDVITLFVDGVPVALASGTSGAYDQPGVPVTANTPTGINQLAFGGGAVALCVGSIRFSRFARYTQAYTPQNY